MRQDVEETRAAVKEVLDSDKLLAGLCLSERAAGPSPGGAPPDAPTEGMREAALLLESYERQISTVEGALKVPSWPSSCCMTSREEVSHASAKGGGKQTSSISCPELASATTKRA